MFRPWLPALLLLSAVFFAASPASSQLVVFETDFEAGLPSEFSAPGASIQGVGGYAGLGQPGNQFSGNFLRYDSVQIFDTALTLTGLPPHDSLSLGFLLAVIDSWDGTELLEVRVDGELVFSHWFQLAQGDDSSYDAPSGALLSSGTDIGFTGGTFHERDRAYDLSLEPAFQNIPHTANTVTITWSLSATSGTAAANWQGGADESWAIDNVRVEVSSSATVPGLSFAAWLLLAALLAALSWKRERLPKAP